MVGFVGVVRIYEFGSPIRELPKACLDSLADPFTSGLHSSCVFVRVLPAVGLFAIASCYIVALDQLGSRGTNVLPDPQPARGEACAEMTDVRTDPYRRR